MGKRGKRRGFNMLVNLLILFVSFVFCDKKTKKPLGAKEILKIVYFLLFFKSKFIF